MYPPQLVAPMRAELTNNGFKELQTPEQVDAQMKEQGTTLLVINSVCGCGARTARPGVLQALAQSAKKPDHLTTSFAGFDSEAVQKARTYLMPYPPTSPSIALLKDGQVVHMIERMDIEGHSVDEVANNLKSALEQYCN